MHMSDPPGEHGKMQIQNQQVCISNRLLRDTHIVGLHVPFVSGEALTYQQCFPRWPQYHPNKYK